MKQCRKCLISKPTSDFTKCRSAKDGLQITCKSCQKEYYEANREHILQRMKDYAEDNPDKMKAKATRYYLNNRDKIIRGTQEYRKTEAGKICMKKVADKEKREYPDRVRARSAVRAAIIAGDLVKQPCEICGTMKHIQAHHDSYVEADFLKVRWLCARHHKQLHQNKL